MEAPSINLRAAARSVALAGFLIGGVFQLLGMAPAHHRVTVFETRPSRNYTTFLNLSFLVLMAVLAWRFLTTGGVQMLRAMAMPPDGQEEPPRDPVCGMTVDPATATESVEHRGLTHHFCSTGYRSAFERNPERYTAEMGHASHGAHIGRTGAD